MPENKTCFVICPFGEEGSEKRKRSNNLIKFVLEPLVREAGYAMLGRTSDIGDPGSIMRSIFKGVYEANLVIADISGLNPNVFYELALRHSVGKPVILISEDVEEPPFDIHDIFVVRKCMEISDGLDAFRCALKKQIAKIDSEPASCQTLAFLEHPFKRVSPSSTAGVEPRAYRWSITYLKTLHTDWLTYQGSEVESFIKAYEKGVEINPLEWDDSYPKRTHDRLVSLGEYLKFKEAAEMNKTIEIDLVCLRSERIGDFYSLSGWANWGSLPLPVSGIESTDSLTLYFTQPAQKTTYKPDVWTELPQYNYKIRFKKNGKAWLGDFYYNPLQDRAVKNASNLIEDEGAQVGEKNKAPIHIGKTTLTLKS